MCDKVCVFAASECPEIMVQCTLADLLITKHV